jgi:SAM-dependent methyltransferase
MSIELKLQEKYWDSAVNDFDSIYSGEKSKFGEFLDRKFRWDMQARFDYTFKHSGNIKGRAILDVGCGTGRFSFEYSGRNAGKVTGIDISGKMIDECKHRAKVEDSNNICDFIRTDLLEYYPGRKFDVCIGIGLFDYIKYPQLVINKMRNLVDDRVIMSFPRLWTWRAPVRKLRLGLKGCSVYFYSRSKIEELLKEAGFENYEIEVVGKLFCVTAYVNK